MGRKTTTEIIGLREIDKILDKIDEQKRASSMLTKTYLAISAVCTITGFAHPFTAAAIGGRVIIEGVKLEYIMGKLSNFEGLLDSYRRTILSGYAESVTMTVTSEYWNETGIEGWVPLKVTGQINKH